MTTRNPDLPDATNKTPIVESTVAVVIPTFNHSRFLGEAIDSVFAQTVPASEIIVVDDGSVDDPQTVVQPYSGIKFVRQVNQGLSAARNTGLSLADSEFAIFLDADDLLMPDAIAKGLACFFVHPGVAAVYGGHRRVSADREPLDIDRYTAIGSDPLASMLQGNPIGMHATVMYDRQILSDIGGFDSALHRSEDYDLYLRLASRFPIASHPSIVADYRWHDSNMSANHPEMLAWTLKVLDRYEPAAGSAYEGVWHAGRRNWREYYVAQMLLDARRSWLSTHSVSQAFFTLRRAAAIDRRYVGKFLTKVAARKASSWLPGSVVSSIKGKVRGIPPVGRVRFGDLDRVTPVSSDFGFDRGKPIDRHYIELFLDKQSDRIVGRVLEIGDDRYSKAYGGSRITQQDVLHILDVGPPVTLTGDITVPGALPDKAFDCMIITQTLQFIFDVDLAVKALHDALRPGGTALVTVPGITPVNRGMWKDMWYWSFTTNAAFKLFARRFGAHNVHIECFGNVYAATAFIQGLCTLDVDIRKLEPVDEALAVIVAVRATKAVAT
jgi:glycosyltransferase involved in cell wall biosynthesis